MIQFFLAKANANTEIQKFEFSTCLKKNNSCILIKADKAESQFISQNMMLKNINIIIRNKKNKVLNSFEEKMGFYDITNNRIVFSKLTNSNTLKETVITLNNLDIQEMEIQ